MISAQRQDLFLITVVIQILSVIAAFGANSESKSDLAGPSFLITQENDLVVRTDRHYTQGLKFHLLAREHEVDEEHWTVPLARYLPNANMNLETARYGLSIGQSIYTPTDISVSTVQKDDRPYAGFLYTQFMLQRRGYTEGHLHLPVIDHLTLDLGIIGAQSLAEEAQNTVHQLRGFGLAQGWKNQLTTEPGAALKYARLWRCSLGGMGAWDNQFIPQLGASLGNVGTYAEMGGLFRFGYRLPNDFGVQTIDAIMPASGGLAQSTPRFGFYVFTGVEVRAIAYSAFLDGNLFHASHHVAKHPMVTDGKIGLVFVFRHFDLMYTHVIRTREFVGQMQNDAFGSLSLRVKW
jgi:lipid A 3-O-deacylase